MTYFIGNHAVAIVYGKECYDTMAISFKEIFSEINQLISDKSIDVDGKMIQLEFFLGGDYKVILYLLCI